MILPALDLARAPRRKHGDTVPRSSIPAFRTGPGPGPGSLTLPARAGFAAGAFVSVAGCNTVTRVET